jgi:manganese/zinc/iron transport system substrate-binding protein
MNFLRLFGIGLGLATMATSGALAEGIRAVCTTGMVADLVRGVAGERAAVTVLMGEGVDPHLFKPTRDDALKLLGAEVVFHNGLLLEGRLGDALTKVARRGISVFAVTEGLDEKTVIEPEGSEGHPDPHVWMDVAAWSRCADVVRDAFVQLDPTNRGEYEANAKALQGHLMELDAYVRTTMGTIPEAQRVLVTAHDAFNYFGRSYGIEVRGIQGISTESEAGVADVNRLVDYLVARKIPAIFVESSVSDKNVKAVIEGAKSRGHAVSIGGQLFSDAMGAAGTYEGTYPGMMDHNATTIAKALGGNPPAGGMNGKLR